MYLTNFKENHKEILLRYFNNVDEIVFATAFFKMSGFNNIKEEVKLLLKQKKKATFYIGLGYGETDANALYSLYNLIKKSNDLKLIICAPDAGIFHPKLYLFRYGLNVKIVIGSSNITEAGWIVNEELSFAWDTNINNLDYIKLDEYFARLFKTYYSKDVSKVIDDYEIQLKDYSDGAPRRPPFRFKRKKTSVLGVDMPRLRKFYEIYKQSDQYILPELREEQYNYALTNLKSIANKRNLNRQRFTDLFGPLVGHKGYTKLWHSGSIHRKTHKTIDYQESFCALVRMILNNINRPIPELFDLCINFVKDKRLSKEISGVGPNIITEILMSVDSTRFGNLNDNPLTVLDEIGPQLKAPESFNGKDYAAYISLLNKIRLDLGMKSFLEIDSFFNYVYWNLLEEG